MASTISDIKKKRGRPRKPGGADPGIFVRLPPDILAALDKAAASMDMSRSEVIRDIIARDLRLPKAKGKKR